MSKITTRGVLSLRGQTFVWGERTYVMGIVNVSPDSFSGDGFGDVDAAALYALRQRDAGADMLDIGAQSTRPGHEAIDAATERARLLPAIAAIRERDATTVLSIDTFKADVFRAAHAAGGDLLNSIWGAPDDLIALCVELGAPLVLMHNRPTADYRGSVVDDVLRELESGAERCVRAGMSQASVILDPGIGFGKTPDHNIAILAALERIVALGFPTLLGTSRKSTIGRLTGRAVDARAYGTAATVALAIAAGIDIVRVHDVAEQTDVARVSDAVVRGWRPAGWPSETP